MAEKWWENVPQDLANWFRIGDRLERALREEQQEKIRLMNIWSRQGKDIATGIKLGLINDPNEEAALRQRMLDLEKEQALLSRGSMSDRDKKAWEDAVKTVLEREKLSSDIKKNVANQLGALQNTRMKTITEFAKFKASGETEAAKVLGDLRKGLEEWEKGPDGGKWKNAPENQGKVLTYLDSPEAMKKVRNLAVGQAAALFNQMGNIPTKTGPNGEQIYDQSKMTPGQKKQLATLIAIDESLKGESDGRGLLQFTANDPNAQNKIKAALKIADQLTTGDQMGDQEGLVTETLKKMPGVKNSDRISKDILRTYKRYRDAFNSAAQVDDNTIAAIQNMKFKTGLELQSLSPQLKRALLANPTARKVANRLNVDLTTPQGGKEVIKFGAENGFRFWKKKQQGGAREGRKSLRSGDFTKDWATDFYMKKTSSSPDDAPTTPPDAEGLPSVDPVEPAVPPVQPPAASDAPIPVEPGPVGVPDVEPEVETTAETAPTVPTIEPPVVAPTEEVDLLADESEDVTIPEASDVEAARERAEFDRQQDLKALEQGEFEDLISDVSQRQDVPVPQGGVQEAFGQPPARQAGSAPNLVPSFQAAQPRGRGALEKALYEQKRQKLLGASNQLPASAPAESAGAPSGIAGETMSPIKAATEAAYKAALETVRRQMTGSSPEAEAQRISAQKRKELQGM